MSTQTRLPLPFFAYNRTMLDSKIQTILQSRSLKMPISGCWLWYYAKNRNYGHICLPGVRTQKAHRLSYEVHIGPIPEGLFVLHKCNTPACINPAHLYVGTHTDNMNDRKRLKRARGGGKIKLSAEDALEATKKYGTYKAAASALGVSPPTVSNTLRRFYNRKEYA